MSLFMRPCYAHGEEVLHSGAACPACAEQDEMSVGIATLRRERDEARYQIQGLQAAQGALLELKERAEKENAELLERIKENNAVCICGCPSDAHENYGEDGEGCGNDEHECFRVGEGALQVVAELREKLDAALAQVEALKVDAQFLCDELDRMIAQEVALRGALEAEEAFTQHATADGERETTESGFLGCCYGVMGCGAQLRETAETKRAQALALTPPAALSDLKRRILAEAHDAIDRALAPGTPVGTALAVLRKYRDDK